MFVELQRATTPKLDLTRLPAPEALQKLSCHYEHHFDVQVGCFATQKDLPEAIDELHILHDVVFLRGNRAASDADMMPLAAFLQGVGPELEAEGPKQETKTPKDTVPAPELMTAHPWLRGHLKRKAEPVLPLPQQPESDEDEDNPSEESGDEAEVFRAFDALEQARADLARTRPTVPIAFEVYLRGGAETVARKSRVLDEFRGLPRLQECRVWSRRYGLQQTYGASVARYGEQVASLMATEWCHRMQYFWQLFCLAEDDDYKYTQADLDGYTPTAWYSEACESADPASPTQRRLMELSQIRPACSVR